MFSIPNPIFILHCPNSSFALLSVTAELFLLHMCSFDCHEFTELLQCIWVQNITTEKRDGYISLCVDMCGIVFVMCIFLWHILALRLEELLGTFFIWMQLLHMHIPVTALSHDLRNFLEFPVSWSPVIIHHYTHSLTHTNINTHTQEYRGLCMSTVWPTLWKHGHKVRQHDDLL